ncbi:outer membrane beta-barrel protein [Gillisia sp. JM1]|uniref:outer membrane beta-barrel protein n=1 Tax=Gillisia sp. JM1 TaxID=1283286 RepID=UPI000406C0BE|nr:outer membrane beta-barrel protein [Gillisia sp. JM1]
MKNTILIFACFVFSFGNAQINFEKGYILTSNEVRKDVLIQNHYNMDRNGIVEYRQNQDVDITKATVNDILEFGIGDDIKYVSRNVEIEVPGTGNNKVESAKDPVLINKRVFLKVILEGDANLYEYAPGGQTKYYYNISDKEEIKPLIYRKYTNENNKILENNEFKKQLFDDLHCSNDTSAKLRNTNYSSNKLTSYFEEYNNCVNSISTRYFEKDSKVKINLNIKPGLNYSTFQLTFGSISGPSREFSKKSSTGFRPAIEAEVILPFFKNKFAVFAEVAHLSFDYKEDRYDQEVSVSFSSLEIPLGFRYYMFLSNNSKLFIDAAVVAVANFNSEVNLQNYDITLTNKPYIQSGIGAKFLDKYSAEVRYSWSRDIIESKDRQWFSDFSSIGLILGYTIF